MTLDHLFDAAAKPKPAPKKVTRKKTAAASKKKD